MAAGRPTKYSDSYIPIARKMAELGATPPEVAEALGVARSSVYLWMTQHEDFAEAMQLGRESADERVERSLFHRAVGYSHREDKINVVQGEVVVTPTTKHYPPDTTAIQFWLTNRQGAKWERTKHVDHTSSDGSMSPKPFADFYVDIDTDETDD